MFFLGKAPESVEILLERLQILSERLLEGFNGECAASTFVNQSQILDLFTPEQLGCIRSGTVTIVSKGVEVACLEAGDLVGVSRVFGLPYPELKVEDVVEIDLFQRDDFVKFVNNDVVRQHRWSNYLLTNSALYQEVLSHFHVKVQVQTPKGFKQINQGDIILREGDMADTVYQLMSGSADVTVNNVMVGEVLNGEIFGAMAVFTGEKRNATVIAREDCQLLAIPKNQFVDLIRAQPETAITLLDNMSRRIKSLNEQVIKQSSHIA
jgi:signal-transduction protein with cAMP-binding, CBS, and nucleotidyltransferase domain